MVVWMGLAFISVTDSVTISFVDTNAQVWLRKTSVNSKINNLRCSSTPTSMVLIVCTKYIFDAAYANHGKCLSPWRHELFICQQWQPFIAEFVASKLPKIFRSCNFFILKLCCNLCASAVFHLLRARNQLSQQSFWTHYALLSWKKERRWRWGAVLLSVQRWFYIHNYHVEHFITRNILLNKHLYRQAIRSRSRSFSLSLSRFHTRRSHAHSLTLSLARSLTHSQTKESWI